MIVEREELLEKLAQIQINSDEFELMPAKDGGFCVLCKNKKSSQYMNSKYNPAKSGEQFAKSVYTNSENIVLYGLGLGYHVKPLQSMLNEKQTLYVFEANLETTKLAFENTDIMRVLDKDNVVFYCGDDLAEFAACMDRAVKSAHNELIIYDPSLIIIPISMKKLEYVLTEYKAAVSMLSSHGAIMEANSEINLAAKYRNGVELLSGAFKGMPVIVVASGASLEKNIGDLKACQNKAIIVCITRSARTLAENGIKPDFYVASDAGRWIRSHLDFETMDAPLCLLSTADSDVADYKGEKLIMFEKGYAKDHGIDCFIEVGGSVATAAIAISTAMGASPVIMIGQDLCYCFDKTHSGYSWVKKLPVKGGKFVLANDGNEYTTTGSLYIYLKWIERFIARQRNTSYYNATFLGAVIEGAPNIDLVKYFNNFPDISCEKNRIKKDITLL